MGGGVVPPPIGLGGLGNDHHGCGLTCSPSGAGPALSALGVMLLVVLVGLALALATAVTALRLVWTFFGLIVALLALGVSTSRLVSPRRRGWRASR